MRIFAQKHHLIGRKAPPKSRDNYTGGTTLQQDSKVIIFLICTVLW